MDHLKTHEELPAHSSALGTLLSRKKGAGFFPPLTLNFDIVSLGSGFQVLKSQLDLRGFLPSSLNTVGWKDLCRFASVPFSTRKTLFTMITDAFNYVGITEQPRNITAATNPSLQSLFRIKQRERERERERKQRLPCRHTGVVRVFRPLFDGFPHGLSNTCLSRSPCFPRTSLQPPFAASFATPEQSTRPRCTTCPTLLQSPPCQPCQALHFEGWESRF